MGANHPLAFRICAKFPALAISKSIQYKLNNTKADTIPNSTEDAF
jgi:hypothetical protein